MTQNNPKHTGHKHSHSSTPKVFDVARPGKAAPSSTTRPLIVSDRPMIKDPMVAMPGDPLGQAGEPLSASKPAIAPAQHIKVNLQPSTETVEAVKAQTQNVPATPVAPAPAPASEASVPVSVQPTAAPSPMATAPAKELSHVAEPSIAIEPPDLAIPEAPAGSLVAPQSAAPPTPAPGSELFSKDTPGISDSEPLVDIAARNRSASMRLAVVGAVLIIVVAIGCVDAMLDAGVLQLSGVPHTHFFKQ